MAAPRSKGRVTKGLTKKSSAMASPTSGLACREHGNSEASQRANYSSKVISMLKELEQFKTELAEDIKGHLDNAPRE